MTPYDLLMMTLYFLGYDINTLKGNVTLSWTIFFITLNVICYKILFMALENDIKKRILYHLAAFIIFGGISLIVSHSVENTEIIMLIFLIGAIAACGIYNIFETQKLFYKKKNCISECLGEVTIMFLGIYIVYQSIDKVAYEGPDYTYGVMITIGIVVLQAVMVIVVKKVIISSQKSNEILRLREQEIANEMYYKNLEERYIRSSQVVYDIKVQLENLREQSEKRKNIEAIKYIDLLERQIEKLERFN